MAEGQAEWEIEARAHATMRRLGAEGTTYPIWVALGPIRTRASAAPRIAGSSATSLCSSPSTHRHMGYCGNMCRPFSIGAPPDQARKLMSVALEAVEAALRDIRPGALASDVFKHYHAILSRYGFEDSTLYGPAHGTGTSEVEGLWLGAGSTLRSSPACSST